MPLKLCKDCRFLSGTECHHETATHTDPDSLVQGPASVMHYLASSMRAGICATNAVHFLPKVTPAANGDPF